MGYCKVSQLNRGSDPEDKGGDGVLQQDTVGNACKTLRSRIEAVITADGSFNKENDSHFVSLQICFYFNKIG